MDPSLRRAWTQIVTPEDYEEHMAAIGQAQAAAALTQYLVESAAPPPGGRVVIAGAGTGQMLDFLDPTLLQPFRLTFTDLNRSFLDRLQTRLTRLRISATALEDDIEQTALEPAPDLLLATLLLEHIDWPRGVDIFTQLRPTACGVITQENPPGMATSLTPGRRLPPSIAKSVETAHSTLIPFDDLVAAFEACGYRLQDTCAREVADGKRLIAALFQLTPTGATL